MDANIEAILYLISGVLFIVGIRSLSSPETARSGNVLSMVGMGIAIVVTIVGIGEITDPLTIAMIAGGITLGGGIGAFVALRVPMTDMPQVVGILNSFGGMSAVLVSVAAVLSPADFNILDAATQAIATRPSIETSLGVIIGAITFSGSVIAAGKLQGIISGSPIVFKGQHPLNALLAISTVVLVGMFAYSGGDPTWFWALTALAFMMGITLIIPIGGADMPVVIAILNSYSGFAGAIVGFTLGNTALIITGALVGSSGAILSYIMCKAMNRSFFSVMLGGFGGEVAAGAGGEEETRPVKQGNADDAAFILKSAGSLIIVPGYGMAVAQAQHAIRELTDELTEKGVSVKFAIHPVAGRMPGHMNVLLAEANVSYDDVYELEDINSEFSQTDVVLVIGANDVTNPSAKTDTSSPIYGMPVLDVENAGTVLFIKRSLASGYAGVNNPLFFEDNTMMLFSDAKKMVEDIVKAL
jgi:NAD(P) transhydrogenase subunit beta